MKKVLQWIGIVFSTIGLGALIMFGIPAMLFIFIIHGLEYEHAAMNDDAESVLRETGLTAYTAYAPWHDLSIGGTLTAFVMPKYDNHVDNTNIWAGIMAHAASHANWAVAPVTADEYTALLRTYLPEAAFLHPTADLVFDAKYVNMTGSDPAELAFFDQESGLMIHLITYSPPHAGTIRADKLTVPHNGYVYTMETHGGFHGDGTTFYALIVPEEQRADFEATLAAHADWQEGVISNEEYRQLHTRHFFQAPPLYPATDVAFEWCSFVDTYARMYPDKEPRADRDAYFPAAMQDAGACWSMNWLVALYDADTGLFICYQYDS